MRGAPQSLRRIHRAAVADERDDPAFCRKRRADRRRHAAAEHAAASEEVAAGLGRHEILDAAERGGGIVGDDRVLRQRVERRQHRGVGASGALALSARMSVRVASLASRRRAPLVASPRRDLVLVDELSEAPAAAASVWLMSPSSAMSAACSRPNASGLSAICMTATPSGTGSASR